MLGVKGSWRCCAEWGLMALLLSCGSAKDPPQGGSGASGELGSGGSAAGVGTSAGGAAARSGAPSKGGAGTILVPSAGAAGRQEGCNELSIVPQPVTPTVLVLVDNSSSMFEPRETLWDLLYQTLMDPNRGVLKPLESKVRFGFASFKGFDLGVKEDDPSCAEIRRVPYALDNFEAIDTLYSQLSTEWNPSVRWETPTGHAIQRVAADLQAYVAEPPGPKYIVLVTDGNPNTCEVANPQCGQDLAIRAVQDAFAIGITTWVVGIGTIVGNDPGCQPSWGRCGPDHLQDLANAGVGLGVAPPPEQYVWQNCADRYGRTLLGSYSLTPGAARFFTATDAAELESSLRGLLTGVVSCTVEMNALVTGNEALGKVTLAGQELPISDPNGWVLEANRYQVTLHGTACERFKSLMAGQRLDITFPCAVAVPR